MNRDELINLLIDKYQLKKYLEIGIGDGVNFNKINCNYKSNVDPFMDERSGQTHKNPPINKMTSDDFFKISKDKFDIIFVDGLHTYEQTLLDIKNSLSSINEDGFVIAHDILPPTEWHQRESNEIEGGEWNGTCWKAIAWLRTNEPNVSINTVDTDWGISIIQKKESELFNYNFNKIDYNFYSKNKKDLLNVISIQDFITIYIDNK